MKERPILFSGPMVRALLERRKTQTRRVVKHQITGPNPPVDIFDWYEGEPPRRKWVGAHRGDGNHPGCGRDNERDNALRLCPYGEPGDRLWVRETWAEVDSDDPRPVYAYRADDPDPRSIDGSWRPSIFMPRGACRLTLGVTGVRVQRLQEISEDDALAEGVGPFDGRSCRHAYEALWQEINGKRAPWASNPWVWVVTFKRIE